MCDIGDRQESPAMHLPSRFLFPARRRPRGSRVQDLVRPETRKPLLEKHKRKAVRQQDSTGAARRAVRQQVLGA